MSTKCFVFVLLMCCSLIVLSSADQGSVLMSDGHASFVPVLDQTATAFGTWEDTTETNGWAVLHVNTSSKFSDNDQAFAAGYLEAVFSQKRIWQYFTNYVQNEFGGTVSPKLYDWLSNNLKWMRSQVDNSAETDPLWQQVGLVLQQFDGLVAGYAAACSDPSEALGEAELFLINAAGDVETLAGVVGQPTRSAQHRTQRDVELSSERPPWGHGLMMDCSALVKLLPDNSNLFSSQVTWRGFFAMLRVYKFYNMQYAAPQTVATSVGFSSQPGFISSKDDFYMTSAGLTVMETTNNVFDTSLYAVLSPSTLLTWVRSIVSNRMAASGADWVRLFAMYNSGTYNNQWIVIDYNQFTPGSAPKDGTLYILEQIPGFTQSGDVTDVLRKQGYWPSYNIPYFANIFNMSGYLPKAAANKQYSYTDCARANIFRRNHTM